MDIELLAKFLDIFLPLGFDKIPQPEAENDKNFIPNPRVKHYRRLLHSKLE